MSAPSSTAVTPSSGCVFVDLDVPDPDIERRIAENLESALAASNEVWANFKDLTAETVNVCKTKAMRAALRAFLRAERG